MRFQGVHKSFGRHKVLSDLDLTVAEGERVALMGPNGAGKTTILRLAAGLLRPTRGTVEATGVFVPQDAPIYPELTAQEHMDFWCRLHDVPAVTTTVPLPHRPAAGLSRGQRQRLHLEMAFATDRPLLLDEPFTGLDAQTAQWLEQKLNDHPHAVLTALHDEAIASRIAHRIIRVEAP